MRYGYRWHSDKPYQTSLMCHLNPYRMRMDVISISSSHEIPLNLSSMRKQNSFETSQTPAENLRV